MPVSFIQKYLVKKLDLTNEAEVCLSFLPCQKAKDVLFFYVVLINYFLGFYFIARYNLSSSFLFDESNKAGKKKKKGKK